MRFGNGLTFEVNYARRVLDGGGLWSLAVEIPFVMNPDEDLHAAQNVVPKRRPGSGNVIDYYEYRAGKECTNFPADSVIFFRYPDPRDPYLGGLSPLRACYEQVVLTSEYSATKSAIYENRAIPSAVSATTGWWDWRSPAVPRGGDDGSRTC